MTDAERKITRAFLIRHGQTRGNLEKRYLGRRTDEGLAVEGVERLRSIAAKTNARIEIAKLFASPMKRCVESAAVLFPNTVPTLLDGLEEIDFGDFEGKTYLELSGDPEYCRWLESGGSIPFPNGESRAEFAARTFDAFKRGIASLRNLNGDAVFVCHGGSVMAILSELTKEDYFSFQVPHGAGYELTVEVDGNDVHIVSYRRIDGGISA